jgi:hypothetical protein
MKANRVVLGGALLLGLAAPVGALGSGPALMHAKLKPIAPVRTGSGNFAASAVETKGTVKMKWQLSLSHLSGSATKATLRLTGLRGVTFVVCKPCSASGHGQVGLVSSVWDNMLAHGAQLVVATRAHPQGELRGTVSRR